MLVEVIQAFYDAEHKEVLRPEGALLDMADAKRAADLIAQGFVKERKITKVSKPKSTQA